MKTSSIKTIAWLIFLGTTWFLIVIEEYAFVLGSLSLLFVLSEIEKETEAELEKQKRKGIERFLNEVIKKNSKEKEQ